MKLVEMKCKNCNAKLEVDEDAKNATCNFCGATFKIDDEVKHIKYDDMEQSGYEFEKGRLRAREEHRNNRRNGRHDNDESKKKRSIWFYILFLMFLPISLTIWILRNDKFDTKKKVLYIVITWIVFIILGFISDAENKQNREEKITICYSVEVYNKLDELIGIDNIDGDFTHGCDSINMRNKDYKKIEVVYLDDKYYGIKLAGKYIDSVNPDEVIYDPVNLRAIEK